MPRPRFFHFVRDYRRLVPYVTRGEYLGTDIVQELLDYAREGCPSHRRFALVEELRIPAPDDSADFACFFSMFTHLLHESRTATCSTRGAS